MTQPRRSTTALLAASLLLAGIGVVVGPAPGAGAAVPCAFAAHRGYTKHQPENSLNAIRAGVYRRATYLEVDVQVTRDGSFFLMHDRTVARTTSGSGRVIDKTGAQMRRLRMPDGQRVPTLGEVMRAARRPTQLMLELKWVPKDRFDDLRRRLAQFGAGRVVVTSFSPYVVREFHAMYPGVRSALATNRSLTVATAKRYGGVMPDHRRISMRRLAELRRAGVATYLWTLDTPALWGRYRGKVSVVVTNRAAEYAAWRRTHC